MRGNEKVLENLGEALKTELSGRSLPQRIHRRNGSRREAHEPDPVLDGTPNMTDIGPIKIGKSVRAQLDNDMALELAAVHHLNSAVGQVKEEEERVDYLEAQIHAIGEMGLENYLPQQLHKGEEDEKG
jgi:bacterioferritin (cytochrome b1)